MLVSVLSVVAAVAAVTAVTVPSILSVTYLKSVHSSLNSHMVRSSWSEMEWGWVKWGKGLVGGR